jgi:hypothetical protein
MTNDDVPNDERSTNDLNPKTEHNFAGSGITSVRHSGFDIPSSLGHSSFSDPRSITKRDTLNDSRPTTHALEPAHKFFAEDSHFADKAMDAVSQDIV